jgi:hypothetical protein
MFSLITLTEASPADKYYTRDVWRTYQNFDQLFQLIDIRNYKANENPAEVTILDRFAFFAAMYFDKVPYENLIERLAGTRNLVFVTSDLHSWSIFPDLIPPGLLALPKLEPSASNYERLFEMFDRLSNRRLITNYDCPELKSIQAQCPSLFTHVIELHINPSVFRDYRRRKKYDVIIYGATLPSGYPFRHRACQLLLASRQFKVLRLEPKRSRYSFRFCGKGLAKKINQSWLGLATTSNFDYLVGKYSKYPHADL